MRSRSLSTPDLPRPVLAQRRHSDPPKATPRHSTLANRLLDDPRKARLVIVSPAESQLDTEDEEQLSAWEAGLQEQGLRVIHLAMDDDAGAIDLLCDMLDPVVDERTQIVVLHDPTIRTKSESRAISGDIGHRLRHSGSHCPAPIVIHTGHLAADELEPRLKALVCVEHEPTGARNAHAVPFARLIAMGDLLDPMPPALLIVKVGSFTAGEQAFLMQLSDSLGSAPLLCLSVTDPAGDLTQIKPLLLARLTPMTPTLVLCSSSNDRMAFMLCHELSMLAGELPDAALAFKPGAVGKAEMATIDHSTPMEALQRLSSTAPEQWKASMAWLDAQYIDQLTAWTKRPGHCDGQYPHAGMAIVRYLTRLLAATQKAPHAPIKAIISVQGLLCLPPLPPHRRFEAITLTGCAFSDLKPLPGGMRSLRVILSGTQDIDLDTATVSCCEQIHLEGNKLTSVPACLWQLPRTVTVFLGGAALANDCRRILQATHHTPGYAGPTFVLVGVVEPASPTAEPALAIALRRLSGLRPAASLPLVWRRALRLMGTDEFVEWVDRLAQLPAALREKIGPKLHTLMSQCAISKSLRLLVLQTVHDASISCDDRILLSWERVQIAVKCHNAARQKWSPAQLIHLGRQVYRFERLMKIAQDRIRQLREFLAATGEDMGALDELQTMLAYLSMSYGPLECDNDTGFGQFIDEDISHVSLKDVSRAIKQVKREENTHFAQFLVTWDPWLKLLQTHKPQQLSAIRDDSNNEQLRQRWTRRVTRNAQAIGLDGRELADAVTKGVVAIANERQVRKLLKLTRAMLQEQDRLDLLDPPWPADHS